MSDRERARPIPMRGDGVLRVGVLLGDSEHAWTLEEWTEIRAAADAAFASFRVKCPTCRCHIYPDATCSCCADTDIETEPYI